MVPGGGIEPPTRGFSIHCSTPELPGHGCSMAAGGALICQWGGAVQRVYEEIARNLCAVGWGDSGYRASAPRFVAKTVCGMGKLDQRLKISHHKNNSKQWLNSCIAGNSKKKIGWMQKPLAPKMGYD